MRVTHHLPHRRSFHFQTVVIAAILLFIPLSAYPQRGAITLPRNLADLTSTASQIVQGRIVSAAIEPDPQYRNLKTLVLTLALDDVLKGSAPKTFTFREFLWDLRDISDRAGYHAGDEVLLFLNRPTTLGLVTPVGLLQGRFRVVRGADGQDYALNGNQNSGLMDNVVRSGALNPARLSASSRTAIQSFQRGPIPLTALKESVHAILKSQGAVR